MTGTYNWWLEIVHTSIEISNVNISGSKVTYSPGPQDWDWYTGY